VSTLRMLRGDAGDSAETLGHAGSGAGLLAVLLAVSESGQAQAGRAAGADAGA